ncbi:phosphatase PAP2 family protein [Geminocystis sp.]|uniref:phosphatase PAP2 family protein n=1 Tax=Geminocystis sp. TaxID=2664100 RepID=UPI0035946085
MKIKYLLKPRNFFKHLNRINLFFSTLALSFFIILSSLVVTGKLKTFDDNLLTKIHTTLPNWFIYIAKTSYFIGEAEVAVWIVIFTLGFLVWKKYWNEAQVLALSTLSILILIDKIFKPLFAIPRPINRLVENAFGKSFPSGHASGNLLLYFLLAYILSQSFPKFKVYFYSLATFLIILMGVSSAYLRVHWVSDILASYSIGYIMFIFSITLLKSSENN